MDTGNLELMIQLIDNLDKASQKLESSFNRKDADAFNNTKNELMQIQKKIAKIIE